ncbi:MAG: bifunctional hydroxymethylpyrimidine kinase/phosphomethylpyrimidine kinase [Treponema sp.]|jgi:pyridoxine kinase|nr:bifunctional hydroxymethylpyrimidine kinase/phosphomethylpyrimidine kinase [Treponema sp.]
MIKIAAIAGSDASGGAGLEADLKTFEEYGLYGMAAVTLIATMDPSNNWAHAVFPLDEKCLRMQMETIFNGIGVAAAKSGMLGTFYAVDLSAEYIRAKNIKNYVLDPVMVCKGAGEALNPELNAAVAEKLLPLAEVVTPNLFEAEQLSGRRDISSIDKMKEAAKIIFDKGARHVFIKGGAKLQDTGAGASKALDLFYDGSNFEVLEAELVKTSWNHGAGCTTSAAIASGLARGLSPRDSAHLAKQFITSSLEKGFPLNQWVGPGSPSAWRPAFGQTAYLTQF